MMNLPTYKTHMYTGNLGLGILVNHRQVEIMMNLPTYKTHVHRELGTGHTGQPQIEITINLPTYKTTVDRELGLSILVNHRQVEIMMNLPIYKTHIDRELANIHVENRQIYQTAIQCNFYSYVQNLKVYSESDGVNVDPHS